MTDLDSVIVSVGHDDLLVASDAEAVRSVKLTRKFTKIAKFASETKTNLSKLLFYRKPFFFFVLKISKSHKTTKPCFHFTRYFFIHFVQITVYNFSFE